MRWGFWQIQRLREGREGEGEYLQGLLDSQASFLQAGGERERSDLQQYWSEGKLGERASPYLT